MPVIVNILTKNKNKIVFIAVKCFFVMKKDASLVNTKSPGSQHGNETFL